MNTLLSLHIGQPQTYTDEQGTWETAFFKITVKGPRFLGTLGLAGDAVANTKAHGGEDQAVLLYAAEHYPRWQAELGQELPYGGFAENLTVSGLDENTVRIGDIYQIGAVKLQVTKPRIPCWKIARRWGIPDLTKRATQTGRTGWYCLVLQTGEIEAGMPIALLEQSVSGETVAQAFQKYLRQNQ
ncbi:MAG TPA: MOSC domain-containing protein [Chloroflexi bacterium]|nr:MOSC domain-containing protein [Chloroflexota bacterium]